MHQKKHPRMRRKNPRQNMRKTLECRRSQWTQKETPGASSSGRGEKCTGTQENEPVKKGVVKSPKRPATRPATPVSPPDDSVKQRLLKKTDLKSDDVLLAQEIKDTDLLHTVNTLLNDETGEEEKPWSEEDENLVST